VRCAYSETEIEEDRIIYGIFFLFFLFLIRMLLYFTIIKYFYNNNNNTRLVRCSWGWAGLGWAKMI
jgi:hypothetical protein